MSVKKELISSELMQEIISIRIDTLWKMLALQRRGFLPLPEEEGATGIYDNKGAVFVPGGIVFQDSDKKDIVKEELPVKSETFKAKIREAMKYDNATLLYQDGIATGINLANSFFAETASDILMNKTAATRTGTVLGEEPPARFDSEQITKSYCPTYVFPPYGSRTKLSSCLSVCLIEPRMYYSQCKNYLGLRSNEEKDFWEKIKGAKKPIIIDDLLLAQPHIVVCHNTRYKPEIMTGITKILGFGKFGEFATFTLEKITQQLLKETHGEKTEFSSDEILAEYREDRIVGVLRVYPKTTPGKRLHATATYLLSHEKDLNIDLERITQEAKERYGIKR